MNVCLQKILLILSFSQYYKFIIVDLTDVKWFAQAESMHEDMSTSGESSSRISTHDMEMIVEKLVNQQTRKSTAKTYLSVWHHFNQFVLSLDIMPPTWEHRTTLYIAYLINKGRQSSSIKSYVSAIKKMLVMDKYKWKDEDVLLHSLTKACKMIIFEVILFEVHRRYGKNQVYLASLYKALFIMCYYGMMHVGEVTESQHVLKAKNIHIALNKDKLLLILYTSKTHGLWTGPQKIKITSNRNEKTGSYLHRNFCPFTILRQYLKLRGDYIDEDEQFFIFSDRSPVKAFHASNLLKKILKSVGIDETLYAMHSFRIGRTSDLVKFGYPIEEVQ